MSYESHDFYCTKCGGKGIPIARNKGYKRESGHLKKLFCIYCGEERNFCETVPGTRYEFKDFLVEYSNNNFDECGNRKMTYNQLKAKLEV